MTIKQLAVLARNPLPTSSAKAAEWLWSSYDALLKIATGHLTFLSTNRKSA